MTMMPIFSGAYYREYPSIMIDITSVPELKGCTFDQNLIVGVGISLNELIDILKAAAKQEFFGYLEKLVDHINLVASIPIRNVSIYLYKLSSSTYIPQLLIFVFLVICL